MSTQPATGTTAKGQVPYLIPAATFLLGLLLGGVAVGGRSTAAPENRVAHPQVTPVTPPPDKTMELPEDDDNQRASDDTIRSFLRIADDVWSQLAEMPSFRRVNNNILIQAFEDGLVIQLVEQEGTPLFEAGSAELTAPIKETLRVIGQELSEHPNRIEVNGHGPDMRGIHPSPTTWTTSIQMADVVRIALERSGIETGQVCKISGCAELRPLNPNNLKDPANRRISILIRPKQWTQERY